MILDIGSSEKGITMSDKTTSLTVTLDDNYKVEDIEDLISAILMFKRVIAVDYNDSNVILHSPMTKAKFNLEQKILRAIR